MAAKKAPSSSGKNPRTTTRAGRKRAPSQKKSAGTRTGAEGKRTTAVAAPVGGRKPVGCLSCGLCCTYIAVETDGPTSVKNATQILWYLYHERVSVYWDHDDDWLVQFETRCRHLGVDNKCGIYDTRPHICREFDETGCEINAEEEGTTFTSAPQFLEFLRTRRKAIYRKLESMGLPDEAALVGPPADRSRLAPFDSRYRRLRMLGAAE